MIAFFMKTPVMRNPRNAQLSRSLTLVEIMISFSVLLAVATSLLYGFTISRRVAEGSIMQSITTDVAQGFLEQIKVMGYQSLKEVVNDPATKSLATYRPVVSGVSATIVPFPMFVDQDHIVPVTMDIKQDGSESSFEMTIRPEVKDLFVSPTNPLPAIEVILHYSYTSNAKDGGYLITGRRVQYVIPKMGSSNS